jgi:predicted DNA-binding transcriptional regulator AlpA
MLEQAIERLTAEVQMVRAAIECQTLAVQQAARQKVSGPAPPIAPSAFLTERAVSDLTGLSVATIRRWRLFRKGPPYKKFGAAVRYSHAELMAWFDDQGK